MQESRASPVLTTLPSCPTTPNGVGLEPDHTTNNLGCGKTSSAVEIIFVEVSSPLKDHGETQPFDNDGLAAFFDDITQAIDFQAADDATSTTPSPFSGSDDSSVVVPETEPCTNTSPDEGVATQEDARGDKAEASPPTRSDVVPDTTAVSLDGPVAQLEAHHSSTPSTPSVSEGTEEHRQGPISCPNSPESFDFSTTMYPATPPTIMYPETPPPQTSPSAAPAQPSCPGHRSSSPNTERVALTESDAARHIQVRFVHQYLGEVTFMRRRDQLVGRSMQRACKHFNIDLQHCRFLLDDGTRIYPDVSIESLHSHKDLDVIDIEIFQEQTGGGVSSSYVRWRTMLDQQRRGAVVRRRSRPSSWRAPARN